jgi:hypothetical protein
MVADGQGEVARLARAEHLFARRGPVAPRVRRDVPIDDRRPRRKVVAVAQPAVQRHLLDAVAVQVVHDLVVARHGVRYVVLGRRQRQAGAGGGQQQ